MPYSPAPYRRMWDDEESLHQNESRQRFRELVLIGVAVWIAIESAWKSLTGG